MDPKDIKQKSYEEILSSGSTLVYTNVGKSMMPMLRQRRDLLTIERKPPGRLKKYDVPLYKRGDRYILHRIVEVTDTGYVIIGDNNVLFEYDVKDEQILGVLTGFVRNDPALLQRFMFWKKDRPMKGRHYSVKDPAYLAYVHLWCDFLPVRICLLKAARKGRRVLSGIWHYIKGDRR